MTYWFERARESIVSGRTKRSFGTSMSEADAAFYELPFQHIVTYVKPVRLMKRRAAYRDRWWIHMEPRPAMRAALTGLARFLGTARVGRHRLLVWLDSSTLADSHLIVFARNDDDFFGVLQSRIHEAWTLQMCSWLGVGDDPRYTPTSTFETFLFPWPPGQEPVGDPRVTAIAEAARELNER
ncbi:MAG: class I SAM-dependent DNA methyltransferase [Chloroflexi bacterium]|nr:class I SAM-dependent DNA methyltransferase [Chloroflexota bacterium]